MTQKRAESVFVDESIIRITEPPTLWTAGHLSLNRARVPAM